MIWRRLHFEREANQDREVVELVNKNPEGSIPWRFIRLWEEVVQNFHASIEKF